MVPAAESPTRRAAGSLVQFGLATTVLLAPRAGHAPTFRAYGVAILLAPAAVAAVTGVRLTPWQRCWASLALSLHPIGAMYDIYGHVWWYDHLAHAASATLVAAVAYSWFRLADIPRLAPARRHLAVLLVAVVAGVVWELWELHVDYLVVYGRADIAADLLFDAVGWLVAVPAEDRLVGRIGSHDGDSGCSPSRE